jgi:hypothetical protein
LRYPGGPDGLPSAWSREEDAMRILVELSQYLLDNRSMDMLAFHAIPGAMIIVD